MGGVGVITTVSREARWGMETALNDSSPATLLIASPFALHKCEVDKPVD